jgi:hypothetical protein
MYAIVADAGFINVCNFFFFFLINFLESTLLTISLLQWYDITLKCPLDLLLLGCYNFSLLNDFIEVCPPFFFFLQD